jgi:hypothetical protein
MPHPRSFLKDQLTGRDRRTPQTLHFVAWTCFKLMGNLSIHKDGSAMLICRFPTMPGVRRSLEKRRGMRSSE